MRSADDKKDCRLGYGLIYTILLHGLLFYVYWAQVDERYPILVAFPQISFHKIGEASLPASG